MSDRVIRARLGIVAIDRDLVLVAGCHRLGFGPIEVTGGHSLGNGAMHDAEDAMHQGYMLQNRHLLLACGILLLHDTGHNTLHWVCRHIAVIIPDMAT